MLMRWLGKCLRNNALKNKKLQITRVTHCGCPFFLQCYNKKSSFLEEPNYAKIPLWNQ